MIELSSKLDTIRTLTELGLNAPSNTGIYRSLNRAADEKYRDKFSAACVKFRGVEQLTLVLYSVTTLFFYVEQEDEYRKPGLSKERRLEPPIVESVPSPPTTTSTSGLSRAASAAYARIAVTDSATCTLTSAPSSRSREAADSAATVPRPFPAVGLTSNVMFAPSTNQLARVIHLSGVESRF